MLRDKFLQGMSNAASTVNIVTTDGLAGRAGLTVSAMSSVSADPPSLLICVNAQSKSAEIISRNGVFCVNVLNDSQVHISDSFSGRHTIEEKFASATWNTRSTGAPALADALVNFDCELKKSFQWGSHYIFIGEIVDVEIQKSGNPLIYANRAYGKAVKMPAQASPIGSVNQVTANHRLGSFITASAFFMPRLIASYRNDGHQDSIELIEGTREGLLERLGAGTLDLAIIYQHGPFVGEGLEAEFLVDVPPYVLLPSSHPMAKQAEVSLESLAQQPLISLATPSAGLGFIDSIFGEAGIKPYKAYDAPSFEVLRGLVGNGLGYAITFTDPASRMSYDGTALVRLPIADRVKSAQLIMVHKVQDDLPVDSLAFIAYCKRHFCRLVSR